MKRTNSAHTSNPIMVRWETRAAKFLQIEISPSHIFRIKIDKVEKGGE